MHEKLEGVKTNLIAREKKGKRAILTIHREGGGGGGVLLTLRLR